ncbi:acyl-CoA thioesterase [bacterium]|nr:acyl-CoA thioesterase [bacterium]
MAHTEPRPIIRPEPLAMYELVFPSDLNPHGSMFGGRVLAMMDKCAGLCVGRWCNRIPVTASIDAIQFVTPIRQGQMIEARAQIVHVGRSSCMARVSVYADDMLSADRFFCCEGYFTMVGIDAHGRPVVLPQIPVETDEEKRQWEIAAKIKENLLARRAQAEPRK